VFHAAMDDYIYKPLSRTCNCGKRVGILDVRMRMHVAAGSENFVITVIQK
jgi:hypothetical protein